MMPFRRTSTWIVKVLVLFSASILTTVPRVEAVSFPFYYSQKQQDDSSASAGDLSSIDLEQAVADAVASVNTNELNRDAIGDASKIPHGQSPPPSVLYEMDGVPFAADPLSVDPIKIVLEKFWVLVRYKPPVGLISLLIATYLVTSGRIFRLAPRPMSKLEAALLKQQSKRQAVGMSFVLDKDDVSYRRYGGVDRIRQKLCSAVLADLSSTISTINRSFEQDEMGVSPAKTQLINSVVQALDCTVLGCRRHVVFSMIPFISRIEGATYTLAVEEENRKGPFGSLSNTPTEVFPSDVESVLSLGAELAQMRCMDGLLRVCRDRLLKTCNRLAKTVDFWSRHLEGLNKLPHVLQSSLEKDRMKLAYARAAYDSEVQRLGYISQILLRRPKDMPEKTLLQVLNASYESKVQSAKAEKERAAMSTNTSGDHTSAVKTRKLGWRQLTSKVGSMTRRRSKPKLRWWQKPISQLSNIPVTQWFRYGTSRVRYGTREIFSSFHRARRLDASQYSISPKESMEVLLEKDAGWTKAASEWTDQGRAAICKVLKDSLRGASLGQGFNEEDFEKLSERWKNTMDTANVDQIQKDWTRILEYVDSLPLWRRMGEGRALRLSDAAIVSWTRQLNIMGLPLAFAQIAFAYWVHQRMVPMWPGLKQETINIYHMVAQIINQRVWIPLKGIHDELMNQGYSLMEGFVLDLEETSLDHMLRDSGFGDGTKDTRAKALEDATIQYEKDMSKGMLLHFATGRLIQLLLIQMQQLKVGMLQALNYIDVLMKGNQIHFQIMAAIPAVLLIWYGTKLFIRALYNIRAKDLRPVTAAHVEMTTYLNQLECILLLSDDEDVSTKSQGVGQAADLYPVNTFSLGEALLFVHRYLVLLQFSSAIIPARQSEDIHNSVVQLNELWRNQADSLGNFDATTDLQSTKLSSKHVQWMRLLKERHECLNQYF